MGEKNTIETSVGNLIPRFTGPDFRTKDRSSLSFFDNGELHSIYLDEQTLIQTPLGELPAELVTFYSDGALDSFFPLNGQIGFAWSEEEEGGLAKTYSFDLGFSTIDVKLNGLRFYPDGSLKSILFWPGETVPLNTPIGLVSARIGIRFFEDGTLESFEPSVPTLIETPIGSVLAYDVSAVGIDASINSVCFDRQGNISQIKTSGDLVISSESGRRRMISSCTRLGLTDETLVKLPLLLCFNEGRLAVKNGIDGDTGNEVGSFDFPIEGNTFLMLPDFDLSGFDCSGDCGGCSICD